MTPLVRIAATKNDNSLAQDHASDASTGVLLRLLNSEILISFLRWCADAEASTNFKVNNDVSEATTKGVDSSLFTASSSGTKNDSKRIQDHASDASAAGVLLGLMYSRRLGGSLYFKVNNDVSEATTKGVDSSLFKASSFLGAIEFFRFFLENAVAIFRKNAGLPLGLGAIVSFVPLE